MTPPRPRQFATIEAGRGLAALAVVLFHASLLFASPKYWQVSPFGSAFAWGDAGVFFFFALSGFIIAEVHARDVGVPASLGRYVKRRLVRIYPVYWIVLAGIVLLGLAGVGARVTPDVLASSIALVGPDNRATAVAVAWTLYHEIVFYAVFAAWVVNVRLGQAVTLAWLALIVVAAFWPLPTAAYLSASVNLVFGFGVAAWWASRRVLSAWVGPAAMLVFAGIAVDTSTARVIPEVWRELAAGAAAAVAVAGLVSLERRRPVVVPRLLMALGAASYSIYLTHYPLLSLFGKLAVATGLIGRVPPGIAFVVVIAATLVTGYVFHRLVERPLLARFRG
ncbi:acyltransferase family protein [Glacieibacterium frigidum]|uniref:acyltransferase family protein n=1 Tax=Glacieibacterium frigidum TaxID=2593303 RepID=UPI00163D3EFD|nr:acyltransferase [Glacieibacterium frigidum]